nr:hypothetical protein [Mycoplasmopsis bovis]
MKDKATSLDEEIINYYIDLGKKDCSIAKKFKSSSIKFYLIGLKKNLQSSKSELFTFFTYFIGFL